MKIKDMYNCVRPVCFVTNIPEAPYSLKGSCFVVQFKDRLFAVTAKHVVAGCRPPDILIPYHAGSEYFLPMPDYFKPDWTDMPEGSSNEDVAFIEIPREHILAEQFREDSVYNLHRDAPYVASREKIKLLVAGFPAQLNYVDYESELIRQQRVIISANPKGSSFEVGLGACEFDGNGNLESYDGFSGSPVFEISDHGNLGQMGCLAGVLIMGSASSKNAHYIDVSLILGVLKNHITQTSKST